MNFKTRKILFMSFFLLFISTILFSFLYPRNSNIDYQTDDLSDFTVFIETDTLIFSGDKNIPIRQGLAIEWNDATAIIKEGIVFAWSDTSEGDRNLYAQLISPTGEKLWGEDGLLIDGGDNRQEDPAITATSDGNVVIAYADFSQPNRITIIASIVHK